MTKGLYYYLKQAWKKPEKNALRERLVQWRKEPVVKKIGRPTRLDRARNLGYKAKKGFVIVRVRIKRGGRKRPRPNKGRRSKRQTNKKVLKMSYQWVAELRAQKKFSTLEVLNSYKIGKDGKNYFFEVILVDRNMPEINKNKDTKWIASPANKNRVYRGLTSAGKKSRGLLKKSRNQKVRPSQRAWDRKGK